MPWTKKSKEAVQVEEAEKGLRNRDPRYNLPKDGVRIGLSTTTRRTSNSSSSRKPPNWLGVRTPITRVGIRLKWKIEKEKEREKLAGDKAMNQLFQQIYQNDYEDYPSGHDQIVPNTRWYITVLSTNWREVAQKDYEQERTAPKSME